MSANPEEFENAEAADSYSGPQFSDEKRSRGGAKEHSVEGVYEAKPREFNAIWPGVRTETFVEMVFGSIKKLGSGATFAGIIKDTGIDDKAFGIAIADLMIWRKDVVSQVLNGERVYVAARSELTKVEPEDRGRFFQSKRSG